MSIFSFVKFEARLVLLVSYSIFYQTAEEHSCAADVVIHRILQLRHQRLLIEYIEIYLLISSDLNSDIAPLVTQRPTDLNGMVVRPYLLLGKCVQLLLVKLD